MAKKHSHRNRGKQQQGKSASPIGRQIDFHIDHLDGLGQGVMKSGNRVTFVAKTLPGESGVARLVAEKKGVGFAVVEQLQQVSEKRREPDCEHYARCPGCHYQHMSYNEELQTKTAALWRMLKAFFDQHDAVEIIAAPQRYGYRNRVQLHYRHQYLGLIDATTDQVLEIPHCKLIRPELQAPLEQLYLDKRWRKTYPGSGHCELYTLGDGTVSIEWNQPYAHGGFTQVNHEMNQRLQQQVYDYAQRGEYDSVLDLFAGDGNLSDALLAAQGSCSRLRVDYAPGGDLGKSSDDSDLRDKSDRKESPEDFMHLDLYADDALPRFRRRTKNHRFDLLLLDPPRKGFAQLGAWLTALRPRRLIYVSCNAATMRRDLQRMQADFHIEFAVDALSLLDLFPATHHFETLAHITLKKIGGKKL